MTGSPIGPSPDTGEAVENAKDAVVFWTRRLLDNPDGFVGGQSIVQHLRSAVAALDDEVVS